VWVLVALAAAIRVAWVLLVPTRPVVDFAMYLESAQWLVSAGGFDPGFAYMPGYVWLLAAVLLAGGGVLAAKLVSVALATAAAAAVHGIARHFFGRRVALAALAMYALWPAGIAWTGVLGTDLPAASLIALAFWALLARAHRPARAAFAFGALIGGAALVRAIAGPLCVLAGVAVRARGGRWSTALGASVAAAATTVLVLLPWGLRNQRRYGELFLTDAHGGLTALLGAYPERDGQFDFAVYRLLEHVTGEPVLSGNHRRVDRVAYRLAVEWAAMDPAYTLGLTVARAERLFERERALLYWPVYRPGVLADGRGRWFRQHERRIAALTNAAWGLVVVGFLCGCGALAVRPGRDALALLLPAMATLAIVYVVLFGEARYRLPIETLALPIAAFGLCWLPGAFARARPWREVIAAACALVVVVGAVEPVTDWARAMRDGHRFSIAACQDHGHPRLCYSRGAAAGRSRDQ
jgi:4-amino-4-deoxy-L-arabinose transferase-like glycosyltransferase